MAVQKALTESACTAQSTLSNERTEYEPYNP